jgi:hypothetical protein
VALIGAIPASVARDNSLVAALQKLADQEFPLGLKEFGYATPDAWSHLHHLVDLLYKDYKAENAEWFSRFITIYLGEADEPCRSTYRL